MNKVINFIGVDISMDTFNVHCFLQGDLLFNNTRSGFNALLKTLNENSWVVMESTGIYHLNLATFLFENEIRCSIVNPLSIKRFGQMKLNRNKTDKSDAKLIAQYSDSQNPTQWIPDELYIQQCKQIDSTVELLIKQSTMIKNKIHSINNQSIKVKTVLSSLKRQLKSKLKEIKLLEETMYNLIKENSQSMLSDLTSIPGVGPKTAVQLIVVTNGFNNTASASSLISYLGLSPTTYQSGSSIRGSSSISKKGNRRARGLLFMCSFTACSHNPQCKKLYDRLTAKGKSKKLALIAVCNKLVKQCFAIANSGVRYDKSYKSTFNIH
jgi:transposase